MTFGTRAQFSPIKEIDFSNIVGTYTAIGTPLTEKIRTVIFTNATDQTVVISQDGIDDHLILVSNSFKLIDLCTNKVKDDGFFISEKTTFFVKFKSLAPTLGSVFIESIFASTG